MTYTFEVLLIGLVLSADSFSAALAMGARPHDTKDTLKLAISSGSAEAFVAFVGAIAGAEIVAKFHYIDHWISFFLLLGVALHMIYEGFQEWGEEPSDEPKKFHGFTKIIIVAFATSLDAFAVGVGLGTVQDKLSPYIISIGVFAFISSILGMAIGKRASSKLGPIANFVAGMILIAMAVKFLYDGL